LNSGAQFVIMGDQNADPNDGDSFDNAILQVLNNPRVNTNFIPTSAGGVRQSIVLVSDNNFSSTQFTQVLALGADLVPTVIPTVETRPDLIDDSTLPFSQRADADDPAIYVNSTDSQKSLVLGSVKNVGLRVYDLSGNLLQEINPGNIRYNNVDLQYGFKLVYAGEGNNTITTANGDNLIYAGAGGEFKNTTFNQ
jgi:Phytase